MYAARSYLRLRLVRRMGCLMKSNWKYYLFLLPAVLISLCIVFIPGAMTIGISMTDWNGFSQDFSFVGLDNFREIFSNRYFWVAFRNNIVWTLLFLTIPVAIGMVAAFLILERRKGRDALQTVFLIPYVLAPVVNAMLWQNIIFNPISGIIGWLKSLGYNVFSPLSNPDVALFAVAAVDIWHYWGFLTIIYFAALRQTPDEQIEAASVEGASFLQKVRYVYFPHIKPTFKLMWSMIIIFSFLAFDYVYLLTQGGPAHATEMLSTFAYSIAFQEFRLGKASAAALFMSIFGLLASFLYLKLSKKEERE